MLNDARRMQMLLVANFIAALGGGTVIRKGMDVVSIPWLHKGSLFAFILGSALGCIFYSFGRTHQKILQSIEPYFSLCSAAISCVLLLLLACYAGTQEHIASLNISLVFVFFLSLRFAFWYYARSIRVAIALANQHSMSGLELSYYLGLITGLVGWSFLDSSAWQIGVTIAFIIDIIVQSIAGICDLRYYRTFHQQEKNTSSKISSQKISSIHLKLFWKLAIATGFIIVGTQSLIFSLTHYYSDNFSAYVISFFYSGTAFAAFLYKKMTMSLDWKKNGHPILTLKFLNKFRNLSLIPILFSLFVIMMGCILTTYLSISDTVEASVINLTGISFIMFTFSAATFVETLLICLITYIGQEEAKFHQKQIVKISYGIMVLGLAVGYFLIGLSQRFEITLPCIAAICLCIIYSLLKKPPIFD